MDQLVIQRYIKDALGLHIALSAWEGRSSLPFYLQDRYQFATTTLLETPCLLVIAQEVHRTDGIRRDLEALQKQLPPATLPIYVVERLESYERRRLIEQGVPFLVPGNQLYVPDLAMDLREHFRKRRSTTSEAFSLTRLRANSAPATTSTTDNDVCATTNALQRTPRRLVTVRWK